MRTQFSTTALLSFYQWMDNYLLQKGQAYTNYASRLYHQPDPTLGTGHIAFAAPFKSFVWDSGVSGANVMGSVSGSFGILSRGQSGLMVDYVNGRIIVPATMLNASSVVSGSYAFKDFNVYFENQLANKMVFTDKFYLNSRFNQQITGIPPAYDMIAPCIFLSNVGEDNQDWSLGGKYDTTFQFKANIMAENLGQLNGAISHLTDSVNSVFPHLEPNVWPLNSFGDFKSGYNYQTILNQYSTPANQFMVTMVRGHALSDSVDIDESQFLGEIMFTVSKPRMIR